MSKNIESGIIVDPFVEIECPYCYNVRNMDGGVFDVESGKCVVYCPTCNHPIILKMFIPKGNVSGLGMDSGHLPTEDW